MKSVEKYPEYQGDPANIQFLTKDEHYEAHKRNWQNHTNWYYDPILKQVKDFGDGKFSPGQIHELSKPIIAIKASSTEHFDRKILESQTQ